MRQPIFLVCDVLTNDQISPVDGHPTPSQTAVFDVVSVNDPIDAASSGAELLTIVQSIFESFPRTHLGEYCIYVSHTQCSSQAIVQSTYSLLLK